MGACLQGGCLFEGWALVHGVGAYLRGSLFDNPVSSVSLFEGGAYLRRALI